MSSSKVTATEALMSTLVLLSVGVVFTAVGGVSSDCTEVMVIKDTTRSWKVALFLPLITLPQVVVLVWLMNAY